VRRTASTPLVLAAAALSLALLTSAAARRADAGPSPAPHPGHPSPSHADAHGHAHAPLVDAFAGTIEGTVTAPARTARRVANPYAPGSAPRAVPPVPMVAFIEGVVAGSPAPRVGQQRPRLAQADTAFQPTLMVVPVGATVDFTNRDPFFHNVFSFSQPKRFDLGRFPRGDSRPVTFDRAGTVKVFCEIHRWMRAAVVVVENPHHAEVRDGRFTLASVPAGRYRVSVWDFDRGKKTVTVDVPASGTARAALAF
jgi:plastocyanin